MVNVLAVLYAGPVARFQRPSEYHKMSVEQKLAHAQERLAEPPVPCPADCGTTLQPADLLAHVEGRCPGPRQPGPAAKWVRRRDAQAMGIPAPTLSRLARANKIRSRGTGMDKEYLHRDLALGAARRWLDRRRSSR